MSIAAPPPSSRHHRSNGDCLEGKRENYQICSVQYCVQQLCTVQCTHIWTDLTVLWIGSCLTGPISLCLDSFLYCVPLYIACMRRFVTWWGGHGGIEAWSLGLLLPSVLWHCWLAHLTRKKTVPEMTYNVFSGTLNPAQSVKPVSHLYFIYIGWSDVIVICDLYVVGQHGILCEVKWSFVALFK